MEEEAENDGVGSDTDIASSTVDELSYYSLNYDKICIRNFSNVHRIDHGVTNELMAKLIAKLSHRMTKLDFYEFLKPFVDEPIFWC